MKQLTPRQILVVVLHGFVGWALCAATMGIGMAAAPLQTALVIHAVAAPVIFAIISWIYFTRFGFTPPLQTAVAFVAVVVFMDVFAVALLVQRSFEMFGSFIGTWLPFMLIFVSAYLTGLFVHSGKSAGRSTS